MRAAALCRWVVQAPRRRGLVPLRGGFFAAGTVWAGTGQPPVKPGTSSRLACVASPGGRPPSTMARYAPRASCLLILPRSPAAPATGRHRRSVLGLSRARARSSPATCSSSPCSPPRSAGSGTCPAGRGCTKPGSWSSSSARSCAHSRGTRPPSTACGSSRAPMPTAPRAPGCGPARAVGGASRRRRPPRRAARRSRCRGRAARDR